MVRSTGDNYRCDKFIGVIKNKKIIIKKEEEEEAASHKPRFGIPDIMLFPFHLAVPRANTRRGFTSGG